MSTNPGNAVGTNAAYGGRTSTDAFNDVLGAYTRGVLNGWQCVPKTGLKVSLGGDGSTRDVAIAEDNAGNRTTINNISGAPIDVTIGAAPGTNSRIDAIVAYVDNPAQGDDTTADNPDACGLIVVQGLVATTPSEPTENAIRTAITADGASGPTAYYVVLATVTIASGTTDITTGDITNGKSAQMNGKNIDFKTVVLPKTTSTEISMGYGYTAYITRIGNIVTLQSWGAFNHDIGDGQTLTETIPNGYKPAIRFRMPRLFIDNSSRWVEWDIRANGTMTIYGNARNGDATIMSYIWVTNDDFPA